MSEEARAQLHRSNLVARAAAECARYEALAGDTTAKADLLAAWDPVVGGLRTGPRVFGVRSEELADPTLFCCPGGQLP